MENLAKRSGGRSCSSARNWTACRRKLKKSGSAKSTISGKSVLKERETGMTASGWNNARTGVAIGRWKHRPADHCTLMGDWQEISDYAGMGSQCPGYFLVKFSRL